MTRKLPDYYSKNATDSTDYHGFKKIIRGIREIRGVLFLLDRHPAGRLDWRQNRFAVWDFLFVSSRRIDDEVEENSCFDFDINNNFGVSTPLAQTKTALARWKISRRFRSK